MIKTIQVLILLTCFLGSVDSQNIGSKGNSETQEEIGGLRNKVDSLNFAFGLSSGNSIRSEYIKGDTLTDAPMYAFIDALNEAYNQELYDDGIYKTGIKVNDFLRKQHYVELMSDSSVCFDQKIVEIGLTDLLNSTGYLMDIQEAQQLLQKYSKTPSSLRNDKDKITKRLINYAYGMTIGSTVKEDFIKADTSNFKTKSFIAGLKADNKKVDNTYSQLVNLGKEFGVSLKKQVKLGLFNDPTLKVDVELIRQGMINGLMGLDGWMTPDEAQEYIKTTLQVLQDKKIEISPNKAADEKFLAENAKKPGIITTASGLQYEVLIKGNGEFPKDSSKVKVNYTGTLIDGTLFDNSKEPIIFPVNQVIKGWTEALKLMPVGSKFKIYVPQELAYGSKQQGLIKPFSMLVYEVELLSIQE